MPIILFAAMFFAGEGFGIMQNGIIPTSLIFNETSDWGLGFGEEGSQPTGNESVEKMKEYDAYYMGNAESKVIYLTFDCGYENGNTEPILDALKKHNAPAAFFVVGHYINTAPEIVKRMVDEGHIVGNHTYHHPDMSSIADTASFENELKLVSDSYKELIGNDMPKFYRPPQGKYNVTNLAMAKNWDLKHFFGVLHMLTGTRITSRNQMRRLKSLLQEYIPARLYCFIILLQQMHI